MTHRAKTQKLVGITDAQLRGLSLGREKGTNHRTGYQHRPESRAKASASHKRWCAEHPDRVAARGEKTRGENHYRWNGGSSRLNTSIRLMHENRKWMDAVKARDGHCMRCGTTKNLEAHHKIELADMLVQFGITNREQARETPELWDLDNGETLCRSCHYAHHGRRLPA